jgi:hypothetical protein
MSSASTKIITNRQLNFTLSPVDTHNVKKMPHTLQHYVIDGTWNHHQSIILDTILDAVFKIAYRNYSKMPQSWRSQKVLQTIDGFLKKSINPSNISFLSSPPLEAYSNYSGYDIVAHLKEIYAREGDINNKINFEKFVDNKLENYKPYQDFLKEMSENNLPLFSDIIIPFDSLKLIKRFPFLDEYRYTLFDHLKIIEATKFKLNYKIKYIESRPKYDEKGKLVERGRLVDLHYKMQDFQNIFFVEGDKRNFKLNFKSPLSKLVIYNTLIMDTDWFPVEAMALSKNAYFLFKRFVLNKVSGKHKAESIMLNFDDAKAFLDFSWSNDRGVHKAIAKALTDMVEKGLVSGYQQNRNHGWERSYDLSFNHNGAGAGVDAGDADD